MLDFIYELYWRYYSSLSKSISLELLPNELLLEILSYVSVSDLFNGWLNLNWRFNTLVHSLSIRAMYIEPERKRSSWSHWWYSWKNSKTDVECLRYFASQIVTLRIDQYFLLDIGNQINIIDYSNIRILKLCQLNANELDLIRADNFPHLEHLSLVKTKKFSLKALCQFKLLRSCQLRSLDIDTQDSNSSSIQSMHIQQCFLWDVSIILRHFPEMIFFKTCISLFNDPAVKSKPFIKFLHTNLRTFRIDFLDIDCWTNDTDHDKYNDIFEFLTSISFNKHIRYYLSLINTKNFNFEQFQHIVRQLNFVHFSCRLIWLHKYQSSPNIDSIRQIPLFNQLQIIWSGAIGTICRTTWTNTSISSY